MINHNIIPHTAAIGCCHYLAIIGCKDCASSGCCHINSVMELLGAQNRVRTVAIIIRNSCIGWCRPGKHTTIVSSSLFSSKLLTFFGNNRFQCLNGFILLGNIRFVLLDCLFLAFDIRGHFIHLVLFRINQFIQRSLFLFNGCLRLIQNLFLLFQALLTKRNIIGMCNIFVQKLTVIFGKHLDIIGFIQHISERIGTENQLHINRVSPLIHKFDTGFHCLILLLLDTLCFFQLCRLIFNFFFFFADKVVQFVNLLLNCRQIRIQLLYVNCQILLGLL